MGPHPYPDIVAKMQSVISEELKWQLQEKVGRDYPDYLIACVGGGSNAAGTIYHYIDDERYARTYVRTYQDSRTVRRITQDLMQKGIDKNTIALAVDEEYTESEEEQIKKLLVKKKYDASLADGKEKDKMYRFLMQRGFKTSDISRALSIDE